MILYLAIRCQGIDFSCRMAGWQACYQFLWKRLSNQNVYFTPYVSSVTQESFLLFSTLLPRLGLSQLFLNSSLKKENVCFSLFIDFSWRLQYGGSQFVYQVNFWRRYSCKRQHEKPLGENNGSIVWHIRICAKTQVLFFLAFLFILFFSCRLSVYL